MPQPQAPDRPDLEPESVVFHAVQGVGWGAVAGATLGAIFHGVEKLSKGPTESSLLWKMGTAAADVGVTLGLIQGFSAYAANRQKQQTKPYVERLEQELVAKSIAADNPQSR